MDRTNSISGILTTTAGVLIIWYASGYGVSGLSPDPLGPSIYPQVLGTAFAVLGILLFGSAFLKRSAKAAEESEEAEEIETTKLFHPANLRVIMIIGTGILYILLFKSLGFIVTATLFIISLMMITGERVWWKIGLTSILTSLCLYFLFKHLLNVLLP